MQSSRVAIIGYGYVGRAMHKIFPDAMLFDPLLLPGEKQQADQKDYINAECELAIVCVPTPMCVTAEDSPEFIPVDMSIINDVVSWLRTPLALFKSTVPPGTTDSFNRISRGPKFCMSPEYIGEGKYQITPWRYMSPTDPRTHNFVIIGGPQSARERIADIFTQQLGPEKTYYLCEAMEAEVIKYMENSWGAMKVIFAQEFFELCKKLGISWHRVREGWALDNRVERMHTAVFTDAQGFGGKCYPKDLNGIVAFADSRGVDMSLVKATLRKNKKIPHAE